METKEEKELSEEELQNLMHLYKQELAHIYKTASAKKAILQKQHAPLLEELLRRCDEDMQQDISALKKHYGIHY